MQKQTIAIVGTLAESLVGFRGELIRDLVASGHTVYAFVSEMTKAQQWRIMELGAKPIRYSLSRLGVNPWRDLYTVYQLYRLFRRYQIDVSFCYFAKPVIYGTLAAKLANVPLRVGKIEGLGRPFTPGVNGFGFAQRLVQQVQVALYRLSLRYCDHLFLLNQDDRQDLIDKHRIKTGHIHQLNGIGLDLTYYQYHPPQSTPLKFVFVGRLLNEKGIRQFIAAAEQLKAEGVSAEFIVVGAPDRGKGSLSARTLLDKVNAGIILYPGKVDDVRQFLQQSSVFVLPSYYREGVPRSTQEAMAVGRAIITSDGPGCRDTVLDGQNGYLVKPRDVDSLVAAMRKYIEHPERVAQHGQLSYQLAQQRYDVRRINLTIIRHIGLYHQQLEVLVDNVVRLRERQAQDIFISKTLQALNAHVR
ncbi:glycosyltransferase family 4 protein [Vibrio metschnikovii]|uniref:glycosyltransferase family 4 protein n=1 Tax=Vibrio metschnikovii TaxID=28172 RepID=UPI002FCAFDA2